MELICKAVFDCVGIPEFMQKICQDEYMRVYSEYAKEANSKSGIPSWNEEYEKLFGKEEHYDNNPRYERFMLKRATQLLNSKPRSMLLHDFEMDEDFYPIAKVRFIPYSRIVVHMYPVEE